MVVRQRADAAAQPDVLRAFGRGGDEHFRRRDDLVATRMVFADPHFVEAELVEVLDEVEVALERERRILPGRMEGCHEKAEAHRRIRCEKASRWQTVRSRVTAIPNESRRRGWARSRNCR